MRSALLIVGYGYSKFWRVAFAGMEIESTTKQAPEQYHHEWCPVPNGEYKIVKISLSIYSICIPSRRK
jgi:hypothetical protein